MSDKAANLIRSCRIAALLLCAGACVVFVALWIRSYRIADRVHGRFWGRQSFVVASKQGRVTLVSHRWEGQPEAWRWQVLSAPINSKRSIPKVAAFPIGGMRMYESAFGFGLIRRPLIVPPDTPQHLRGPVVVEFVDSLDVINTAGRGRTSLNGSAVIIPYWFLVLVAGVMSAVLLTRRFSSFSLRGLLLAFAFAAVLLGLIAILDLAPIPINDHPDTPDEVMDFLRKFDIPAALDEL
jgi:hypothetical protein